VPNALQATSSGSVVVNNGCIQVNSDDDKAALASSSGNIQSTENRVHGGCHRSSSGQFIPPCVEADAVPDPLAWIPHPTGIGLPASRPSGCTAGSPPNCIFNSSDPTVTLVPGVYRSIKTTGDTNIVLGPGTYVITGEFGSSSNGSITANGVTLFFACSDNKAPYYKDCKSTGESGGNLSLTSNAGLTISGPASGPYKNLPIFYDRNNTSNLDLTSSGSVSTTGTIYAASAAMNVESSGSSFSSLLVVDTLKVSSGGPVTVNYNPSQNVEVSRGSKLVE
jgi:hypothetical protein